MRIARAQTGDGIISGEYVDGRIVANDGKEYSLENGASLLPPCAPTAIYCAGRNFEDYLELQGNERPEQPHFFLKPPAALWAPEKPIPYPSFADGVGYAGELAAVIDRRCQNVDSAAVDDYIRGYTIMNDVDAIGEPGSAMKVFDAAAPLGPWIETEVTPNSMAMETKVGGELRQEGNTDEMIFGVAEIVSFLSERVTLKSGDVVAFGSPANPGSVDPGERIEMWYEGIGTLSNELAPPE